MLVSCKTIPLASSSKNQDFSNYILKLYDSQSSKYYACDQVNVSIRTEEGSKSVRAKVYIHVGEFIYASISFLGIEIARAELSPDSIKFINRFDKTYYFGSIKDLPGLYNISLDYSQLEALLIKGIVTDKSLNKKRLNSHISETDSFYFYSFVPDMNSYVKTYFNKLDFKENKIEIVNRPAEFFLLASINEYQEIINYPANMNISLINGKTRAEIDLNIGRISKERNNRKSFEINSRYSEISF